MKKLFTDYAFPAERSVEKLSDFTSYYDRLSERFGFDVGFPEQTLYLRADGLARAGKVDNAIEMLTYLAEWNPRSINAFWCLANIHRELGDRENAIEFYRKCLEIMPNMAPARDWLQKLSADQQ